MTVRGVLDILDIDIEEHQKAIYLHQGAVNRLRGKRLELIAAANETMEAQKREAKNRTRRKKETDHGTSG